MNLVRGSFRFITGHRRQAGLRDPRADRIDHRARHHLRRLREARRHGVAPAHRRRGRGLHGLGQVPRARRAWQAHPHLARHGRRAGQMGGPARQGGRRVRFGVPVRHRARPASIPTRSSRASRSCSARSRRSRTPKGYDDGDKGDKGDKGDDDGGRKGEATKKASKDDDDEPHAKTKHVERTYEGERYRRPRREANDAKAAAKGLNIMLGIGGGLKFGGGGGHRGKY